MGGLRYDVLMADIVSIFQYISMVSLIHQPDDIIVTIVMDLQLGKWILM